MCTNDYSPKEGVLRSNQSNLLQPIFFLNATEPLDFVYQNDSSSSPVTHYNVALLSTWNSGTGQQLRDGWTRLTFIRNITSRFIRIAHIHMHARTNMHTHVCICICTHIIKYLLLHCTVLVQSFADCIAVKNYVNINYWEK